MADSGQITWRGDSGNSTGNYAITRVEGIDTSGKLRDFALNVSDHNLCNFAYRHFIRTTPWYTLPPEAGANVDKKAIIYFRDPDTLEKLHFSYPSPIATDIETTGAGDRIKQSAVILLVGYLSAEVGIAFQPLYGVYTQRR